MLLAEVQMSYCSHTFTVQPLAQQWIPHLFQMLENLFYKTLSHC